MPATPVSIATRGPAVAVARGPITTVGVYAAFTTAFPTGIDDQPHGTVIPDKFELGQNYPNPFNPTTTLEYGVPNRSHVRIEVFNILGQSIRTLVDEEKSAGRYQSVWDGTDKSGHSVSSGVYLYRITAGEFVQSKKMLLLK